MPKVGPFRGLAYKDPTPKTEDLYIQSVNKTVTALQTDLRMVRQGNVEFPAIDLDTGAPTRAGEYTLADDSYRKLLRLLKKDNFGHTDAELQTAMVHYFTAFQPKLRNSCDPKQ